MSSIKGKQLPEHNRKLPGLVSRLRKSLEFSGLTQKDIDSKLGLAQGHASKWLREKFTPSAYLLVEFSCLTGVGLEWLLTGEGEMLKDKSGDCTDEAYCPDGELPSDKAKLARLNVLVEKVYKLGTLSQRAILRGVLEELDDEIERMKTAPKRKK